MDDSWPSWYDKNKLIKHIGKSFIFMRTILKALFDPVTDDGLTPMERLPILLSTEPDFDSFYKTLLQPLRCVPHFLDIIRTIALAREAVSISQIADLLKVKTSQVTNVLIHLHAIMQVPGDDRSPATLWHTSLRDFLCSGSRAGPFFESPPHHQRLAYEAIRIAASNERSPSSDYARTFGMQQLSEFLNTMVGMASFDALLGEIRQHFNASSSCFHSSGDRHSHYSACAPPVDNRTALEVALRWGQWKLVHALVHGNADVNARFIGVPP